MDLCANAFPRADAYANQANRIAKPNPEAKADTYASTNTNANQITQDSQKRERKLPFFDCLLLPRPTLVALFRADGAGLGFGGALQRILAGELADFVP